MLTQLSTRYSLYETRMARFHWKNNKCSTLWWDRVVDHGFLAYNCILDPVLETESSISHKLPCLSFKWVIVIITIILIYATTLCCFIHYLLNSTLFVGVCMFFLDNTTTIAEFAISVTRMKNGAMYPESYSCVINLRPL